jgi:DNA repair protein RadC
LNANQNDDAPDNRLPSERLLRQGAAALSNAELLAIILCSDTLPLAERILDHYDGLYGLAEASTAELLTIEGLSSARIVQIAATFELSKRLITSKSEKQVPITSAADAARYVADMAYLIQENVRVLLLDSARRIVATPTIYIGTLTTSVLRVSEVYREAITRNCPALILVHNHPSGDPTPSPEDIELTRTLVNAGRLLDIALLDHIIIGGQRWVSLSEMGFVY